MKLTRWRIMPLWRCDGTATCWTEEYLFDARDAQSQERKGKVGVVSGTFFSHFHRPRTLTRSLTPVPAPSSLADFAACDIAEPCTSLHSSDRLVDWRRLAARRRHERRDALLKNVRTLVRGAGGARAGSGGLGPWGKPESRAAAPLAASSAARRGRYSAARRASTTRSMTRHNRSAVGPIRRWRFEVIG